MGKLRAVIVGAGRMAGTIDDEVRDDPYWMLPYSHAAGYAEFPDIDLVAIADLDPAKTANLQQRYGIPRAYSDYREMILAEKPDLVSITTPGTTHAEIAVFAAENGARGVYCEKAFACSLEEADRVVAAVERSGAKFNMGTLRRWNAGANRAKQLIDEGEIGAVNSVISYSCGSLLHSASHFIDMILYFAHDAPVEWVQGTVSGDLEPSATRSETDLDATAVIRFANGVTGYLMNSPLWAQYEVVCSAGALRTVNDCGQWSLWKQDPAAKYRRYREHPFPEYQWESSTVRLIRDLVQAVETGGETMQGVRRAAMTAEIAFAVVESHKRGGARVTLPVEDRSFWMFTH